MEEVTTSIPIQTYDWLEHTPDHGFSIICDGCRNAGKTTALQHICYTIKDNYKFDVTMLISGTAEIQTDVFKYVPDDLKYDADDMEAVLEKIISIQKEDLKKHKGDKKKVKPVPASRFK